MNETPNEEQSEDQSSTIQSQDNQTNLQSPALPISEPTKHKSRRKLSLKFPRLPRWLVAGLVVIVLGGLLTGCYLLNKKSNDLSLQNQELNNTIDGLNEEDAKPEQLADAALQTVDSDIKTPPAPAPAVSGSYGGTAVQVNADDPTSSTPKYIGGEYAPYWLLTKFALTIPDGTKMVRTTNVETDGHLLTADNEGGAGCGGEGIYMTVSSTVSIDGGVFKAQGSSATYARGVGCGGADPIATVYAKYYPMSKASQYKYMELATAECTTLDKNYNCVGNSTDKSKWRIYSGIILKDAAEHKVGDITDGNDIAKQLYNRDKNGAQFYLNCSSNQYGDFSCNALDYKNSNYEVALKDSSYIHLRNIVLNMHEY